MFTSKPLPPLPLPTVEVEEDRDPKSIDQKIEQKSIENLNNFLGYLSHELYNPVNGIVGSLETIRVFLNAHPLKADPGFKEATNSLSDIELCTNHIKSILDKNLELFEMYQKEFKLNHDLFNFKTTMQEACQSVKNKADKKGLGFKLILPDEELIVMGDAQRVKQIAVNLIANAIKFTEKGSVEIAINVLKHLATSTQIEIKVTDTGYGMDKEKINILFTQNPQIAATNQYKGTGLSLRITKKLAKLMNGDIKIESTPGYGSTFNCTIECGTPQLVQSFQLAEIKSSGNEVKPVFSSDQRIKVLVVEDNEVQSKNINKNVN